MKTLGRALIILAVFALLMGITYIVVTAGTSGSNATQFQRGDRAFPRPNFTNGQRPEFPGGGRNEFHREGGSGEMMFGMIKNIVVISIVVALVVLPKGWMQKRRRTAQVAG